MAIALKNIIVRTSNYIANNGPVPSPRQQGVWEFGVGNGSVCFYKSSYANQVTLAKKEAQSMGLTSITLLRRVI